MYSFRVGCDCPFLSPVPMPRLWSKAQAEMRAGSWLISNTFEIPGVPADRELDVNEGRQTSLFLWQMQGAEIR